MKHILMYCWNSLCEPMAVRAMEEQGIKVIKLEDEIKDYHADAVFSQKCLQMIRAEQINAVFSYDYFPILSMISQVADIPYISWIFDCPMYTLQSKTLGNSCNHIFCFDKAYAQRLREDGGIHIYPFVLGTDLKLYKRALERNHSGLRYDCDISFVGSLYNEKNRLLQLERFGEYTRGYLEGIINAQLKIYGCNIVKESLTKEAGREIVNILGLSMGDFYRFEPESLAADAVNKEITGRERLAVVDRITKELSLDIYTGSRLPDELQSRKTLINKGYVDYFMQMPLVFQQSRINLNITAKTIESGIPQRIADILACGGFCLTNYQPEIAEYLEDGKEIVMYESMEDMMDKIKYYLSHEKERLAIAQNGEVKAAGIFDIRNKVEEMMKIID